MACAFIKQYESIVDFDQKSLAGMFVFTYVTVILCLAAMLTACEAQTEILKSMIANTR